MTPSGYQLFGLIQKRSEGEHTTWVRISLSEWTAYLKLSERTLRRAKAELDSFGLVRFRTVSNGEGRGHKLHACLPSKLVGKRGELLHQSSSGKIRIARTKVGGRVIHKPRLRSDHRTLTNTMSSRSEHHDNKTLTVKRSLGSQPSKKQIALAHWLKHELWRRHSWDNCKVLKSDAHAFGFALRAIQAGFDIDAIHKSFEAALKTMHGTATDVGLHSGQPTHTRFCLSSTVSLAQRKLRESGYTRFRSNRETRPKLTRSVLHTPKQKAEPHHQKPIERTVHTRSPLSVPSQSARFADIASALA